jgi:hypothetical protein
VLIAYSVTHTEPLVYLFAWLTTIGGLGVLILMWAASAAVMVFFLRNRRGENVWRRLIAPLLAFLLLTGVLAATVIGLGDLLQVSPSSPFRWLFPVAYAAFAVLGFGWALIMRAGRPEVYATIGRGADGRVATGIVPPPRRPLAEPVTVRAPHV